MNTSGHISVAPLRPNIRGCDTSPLAQQVALDKMGTDTVSIAKKPRDKEPKNKTNRKQRNKTSTQHSSKRVV
jgi:hypothetical protein